MVVGLEIKKDMVIQAILEDPTSAERALAREFLTEGVTLRTIMDEIGFTDSLGDFELYELGWVLGNMEPEVEQSIMVTLRFAFACELPVIFDWYKRDASCEVKTTVVGGKVFLTLGTPALDKANLQPGAFAGAMS